MRLRLLASLLFFALAFPVAAQVVNTSAQVVDWPLSTIERQPVEARYWRGFDILPFVETLNLTMAVAEADGQPDVAARVLWRMGREGVKRGRRVPASELPAGVRLVAFVLRADVVQDGARVAGLTLGVDSTRLAAGETLVLHPLADWATLFDEATAEQARAIVAAGFTLENLQLVRAAFAVFDAGTSAAPTGTTRERHESVTHRTVYATRVWIDVAWDLAWLMGPDYRDRHTSARAAGPRGGTGRGREGKKSRSEDEEDEDDSGELLPAALMMGAGIAAVAVFGGSAGYVAQAREPFGVAAGFVRPRGGVLLQASANEGALGMRKQDESMSAQVFAFGGGYAVQPAVGLGIRYHERAGVMRADPTFTPGAVVRARKVSLLAGYEVFGGSPVFGVFFSWKMH